MASDETPYSVQAFRFPAEAGCFTLHVPAPAYYLGVGEEQLPVPFAKDFQPAAGTPPARSYQWVLWFLCRPGNATLACGFLLIETGENLPTGTGQHRATVELPVSGGFATLHLFDFDRTLGAEERADVTPENLAK